MTRMLGKLSDLRMQFGAEINYGDPKDVVNIARHQALGQVTHGAMMRPKLTRFLASLSDAQWEQMKGNGLRRDHDLSPEQQAMLAAAMPSSGQTSGLMDRVVTLDREAEASGLYSVVLTAFTLGRDGRNIGWGSGLPYANKELRVDALAPN